MGQTEERYIVVTGNLENKGLRAMVYIVADRMAEIMSGHRMVLLATGYAVTVSRGNQYCFQILPWKMRTRLAFLGPICWFGAVLLGFRRRTDHADRIRDILGRTDLALDLSGYSLSSQWPLGETVKYLLHIAVMKKFGIKLCLMPGPSAPSPTHGRRDRSSSPCSNDS